MFSRKRRKNLEQQVREFHVVFGHPAPSEPETPSRELAQLRLRLIAEEFCELLEAHAPAHVADYIDSTKQSLFNVIDFITADAPPVNHHGALDAIADLLYVVAGTGVAYGYNVTAASDEVHASNMSKLSDEGLPIYDSRGKVVKGPNYRPPLLDPWEPQR